jgi:glycine cleavage system H protein
MSLHFTTEHEWIRVEGDVGVVGITSFASEKLGDVVFVDLPSVGKKVTRGGDMAVVESVKAASDVYAPVDGEIVAVNEALGGAPETVNAEPEGAGWFCRLRITNAAQLSGLMDRAAYDAFCATQ